VETVEPEETPALESAVTDEQAPPEPTTWVPQPVSSYEAAEPEAAPAWSASEPEAPVEEPAAVEVEAAPAAWEASEPETPVEEAAAVEAEAAPSATAAAQAMLFGRVQVNISPVPDFDRLLSLDSALSRVGSVQSVTLADYAQEEVTFRIDLASPLAANDFAQQLSEAAGFNADVESADGSTITLRLG
jgi:hypothetical protein